MYVPKLIHISTRFAYSILHYFSGKNSCMRFENSKNTYGPYRVNGRRKTIQFLKSMTCSMCLVPPSPLAAVVGRVRATGSMYDCGKFLLSFFLSF